MVTTGGTLAACTELIKKQLPNARFKHMVFYKTMLASLMLRVPYESFRVDRVASIAAEQVLPSPQEPTPESAEKARVLQLALTQVLEWSGNSHAYRLHPKLLPALLDIAYDKCTMLKQFVATGSIKNWTSFVRCRGSLLDTDGVFGSFHQPPEDGEDQSAVYVFSVTAASIKAIEAICQHQPLAKDERFVFQKMLNDARSAALLVSGDNPYTIDYAGQTMKWWQRTRAHNEDHEQLGDRIAALVRGKPGFEVINTVFFQQEDLRRVQQLTHASDMEVHNAAECFIDGFFACGIGEGGMSKGTPGLQFCTISEQITLAIILLARQLHELMPDMSSHGCKALLRHYVSLPKLLGSHVAARVYHALAHLEIANLQSLTVDVLLRILGEIAGTHTHTT